MRRIVRFAGLTALAVVMATGCRRVRHHDGNDRGAPEAFWPAAQMTANEGSAFDVVLTLDQVWDAPVTITLTSSDSSRVSLPASVTFPTGVTTRTVSITTFVDTDTTDSLVLVHAVSLLDTNSMGILLRETGTAIGGALGPVAAGPNRALLVTDGPDGIWSTADDTLTIASGVGSGIPTLTSVTIGAVTPGPQALPVVTGVMDTALVMTNGPDLTLGTSDDTLVEVSGISTSTPSQSASQVVGRMEASEGRRPVMVGTTAVFATRGADLLTSADDQLVMIGGIGTGTLTMSFFGVPGVAFETPSLLAVVNSTSVALHVTGPDFTFDTAADDLVVVTGIGAAPSSIIFSAVTLLPGGRIGSVIPVDGTTIGIIGTGLNGVLGNADDQLGIIQDVFGVPVGLGLTIGPISTDPEAQAFSTPGDSVLVPMLGPDLLENTIDDQVALVVSVSAPGPLLPASLLLAERPAAGALGRIVVTSATTAVLLTTGADGALGSADDGLTLLTDLTGAGASATFATGSLQPVAPLVISSGSVALVGEGVDGSPGTSDDEIVVVSGIGGSPALDTAFPGPFRLSGPGALVPNGASFIYLARTVGADAAAGTGDDRLTTGSLP